MRLLGILALIAGLAAQTPKTGPVEGSAAPAFSLPDQAGETRTLQSLMGPKGLMLVFYRSADW
jgi:hypothetical protein